MITHDIAEAVSMADRVIVLTDRPSKVKCEYQINMKDKSTPMHNRNLIEFKQYYDKIWKDIDIHVQSGTHKLSKEKKKKKNTNILFSNTNIIIHNHRMGTLS